MNHLLPSLVLGASCCFFASTCLAVEGETIGSAYENKALGTQMRVPPGWDYEDLGSQAPQKRGSRYQFLSHNGADYITRFPERYGTEEARRGTWMASLWPWTVQFNLLKVEQVKFRGCA